MAQIQREKRIALYPLFVLLRLFASAFLTFIVVLIFKTGGHNIYYKSCIIYNFPFVNRLDTPVCDVSYWADTVLWNCTFSKLFIYSFISNHSRKVKYAVNSARINNNS